MAWIKFNRVGMTGMTIARVMGIALLCGLLVLTLGQNVARPQLWPDQDKVEHLFAFLALGFLFGLGESFPGLVVRAAALTCAVFGIEAAQDILPFARQGGLGDALAGCLGLALGIAAAVVVNGSAALLQRWRVRASSASPEC